MRVRGVARVAAVAAALLLAGCADAGDGDVTPSPEASATPGEARMEQVPGTEGWPFASYQTVNWGDASRLAGLSGTLGLLGGCLVVISPHVGVPASALMLDASYYTWEDGALVAGDERWEIGDEVWFGGGEASYEHAREFGLPEGCPTEVFGTW